MTESNKYLAYFDTLGFECVINLTEAENDCIMATLRGEEYNLPFSLHHMTLRARFNPQRFPEIWVFNVSNDLSTNNVIDLANNNPQYLANFIRANGTSLYSKHSTKNVID
jgi:hypothetical protein